MYAVLFSSGIIEGGSSGSGLFTLAGDHLELRGVLTGTTVNQPGGMSCTDLNEYALYDRFEVFEPEIDQYIRLAPQAADDAPNRPQDLFNAPADPAQVLDQRTSTFALDGQHIDYAGDLDVYRFVLGTPAWVSTWTEGPNLDTVGGILDSRGVSLANNDDAQVGDNHFGITTRLGPGTYYVQVGHWDAAGTGSYNFRMRSDDVDTNYTDLWWNPAESGWGVNVNHQGNIALRDALHLRHRRLADVARDVRRREAGRRLVRGQPVPHDRARLQRPALHAHRGVELQPGGYHALRLLRGECRDAQLHRQRRDGHQVHHARIAFSTSPTCSWSAFDRSYASNYQDLWWNPTESGWGVNVTHQGDILFATLFTYDNTVTGTNRGLWLVMSNGARQPDGSYLGDLYRTTGPAFNAQPFTPIGPSNYTKVGTMTLHVHERQRPATHLLGERHAGDQRISSARSFNAIKTDCQ